MTKHHHKDKAEQIKNKINDEAQVAQNKMLYKKNAIGSSEKNGEKGIIDDSLIQLRAYQIYHEKGGTALENWLEAERILSQVNDNQFLTVKDDGPETYKKINSRMAKIDVYR
jgi:hypothetical protein